MDGVRVLRVAPFAVDKCLVAQQCRTACGKKVYDIASITNASEDIMLNLKDPTLLRHQALIDGEWCDAQDANTVHVINPATGAEDSW